MVTERMTRPPEPLADPSVPRVPPGPQQNSGNSGGASAPWFRQPLKRYGTSALALSVAAGVLLVLAGFVPQGKGLVLGAVFSTINFALMAVALPMRLGRARGPVTRE